MHVYEDFVCTYILLIVLVISSFGLVVFTEYCTVPLFESRGFDTRSCFYFLCPDRPPASVLLYDKVAVQ